MAEIIPFKAWRYNPDIFISIGDLTSPLFDVVSDLQRLKLYNNPYNSIHLSAPAESVTNRSTAELLESWKQNNILVQDEHPAIYIYYQYFSLPGSSREYCRKGFIANIRASDWSEEIILRHENTIPHSVDDRLDLLRKTLFNASPTHGLYTDPEFRLEQLMDASMRHPIYDFEDYQGVRDVLSIISEPADIKTFMEVMKAKKVILADGHHRYEACLLYRKEREAANPYHTGREAYNFHLMYFTNTEADDLRVLPTHRLISGFENLQDAELLKKLEQYFHVNELDNPFDINTIILGKKWAFGLLLKNRSFLIRLKPAVFNKLSWKMPKEVKELDLTVLHYFIIDKCLGIPGKLQRHSSQISFESNFSACLAGILKGEFQMAVIIKDIAMDEIKKVCYSGYTFPQKSTYFYPKVICGYLFSSIKDDEFEIPSYIGV